MSRIIEKLTVNSLLEVADFYKGRLSSLLSLPATIALLRKRLRMSQRTLSRRCKVPQATLSRIESGRIKPTLKTMEKIFHALFCDIVFLPIPKQDLDLLVDRRLQSIAEKRVKHIKGTMALELQQPQEAVLKELIAHEKQDLLNRENFDIWQDDDKHL